jgi:hypothetical protein
MKYVKVFAHIDIEPSDLLSSLDSKEKMELHIKN